MKRIKAFYRAYEEQIVGFIILVIVLMLGAVFVIAHS